MRDKAGKEQKQKVKERWPLSECDVKDLCCIGYGFETTRQRCALFIFIFFTSLFVTADNMFGFWQMCVKHIQPKLLSFQQRRKESLLDLRDSRT